MNGRRQTKRKNQRANGRLLLGITRATSEVWTIPTRWLNTVVAIFLLPVAYLLTQTFFGSFSRAAIDNAFWATEEFFFFCLGAALWLIAFCGGLWIWGEPRPLRVYVFGHELTHAIWVWFMGGRVSQFQVAREGGQITTDTHNFWIALAPYFYPLYSVAVIAGFGAVSIFYDLGNFVWLLFGLIGLTWSFHMSFTLWMIPKGQSDLAYHGTFFSLVVIYLINLVLLSALLIIAAPEISWAEFGTELQRNAEELAAWAWHLGRPPA